MAQVTPQGIVGVSLNEYLAMIETGMLAIDPKWNIDPDSPDGQKNGIDAETLANLDEGIVAAYRSKDPASATGESLNDIGAISGVPRQFATFSVAPITLSGTPGASIPAVHFGKQWMQKMNKEGFAKEALNPYGGLTKD